MLFLTCVPKGLSLSGQIIETSKLSTMTLFVILFLMKTSEIIERVRAPDINRVGF